MTCNHFKPICFYSADFNSFKTGLQNFGTKFMALYNTIGTIFGTTCVMPYNVCEPSNVYLMLYCKQAILKSYYSIKSSCYRSLPYKSKYTV